MQQQRRQTCSLTAPTSTLAWLAAAFLASQATAQQFDWQATFNGDGLGAAGSSGEIRAFAAAPGANGAEQMFVVGDFDSISGCVAPAVALWDGAAFRSLPGQLDGGASSAVWFQGQLYVSGNLTVAGVSKRIVRWDGANWLDLAGSQGVGLAGPGTALDLVIHDDGAGEALFVIGWFTHAGGVPASNVAKWNGSDWSAVGDGLDNIAHHGVVWDDGAGAKLYVTGFFAHSGGNAMQGVARWNGANWEAVGSGAPTTGTKLGAYSHPTLGGVFASSGGSTRRFDGATWSTVGAFATEDFLEFDDGSGARFFAAAGAQLREWDGLQWTALADFAGPSWGVRALGAADFGAQGGHVLFAGGGFTAVSAASLPTPLTTRGLALFDGATWSAAHGSLANGLDNNAKAFVRFDDGRGEALYVGGDFTDAGGVAAHRVVRWDGAEWEALGAGVSGSVNALAVHDDGSGDALYAGGNFVLAGGSPASRVARWSGSSWTALAGGVSGPVNALISFDDGTGPALIVGGQFNTFLTAPSVARWNGASWSPMGSGLSSTVRAFAVADHGSGPQLYAGGDFTASGTTPIYNIARWTGSSWVAVGGGVDAGVYTLLGDGADLYVGGEFAHVDGSATPLSRLARWSGWAWSAVCVPWPNNRVQCLTMFDDGRGRALYVGGRFDLPVARVGRLEAGSLEPLGASVNWYVAALESFDDGQAPSPALYAGGPFESAGAFRSSHIARWADGVVPPPTTYCTAGTTTNGCQALMSSSGEPSRSSGAAFEIDVSGVEGQKTGILFFGFTPTNSHWGSGSSFVCVAPPTIRASTQSSAGTAGACDGAFQLDFNAWMAANSFRAPQAGDEAFVQAWFRDPGSAKATSLSNALRLVVAP